VCVYVYVYVCACVYVLVCVCLCVCVCVWYLCLVNECGLAHIQLLRAYNSVSVCASASVLARMHVCVFERIRSSFVVSKMGYFRSLVRSRTELFNRHILTKEGERSRTGGEKINRQETMIAIVQSKRS
jgi:hypothetical protein